MVIIQWGVSVALRAQTRFARLAADLVMRNDHMSFDTRFRILKPKGEELLKPLQDSLGLEALPRFFHPLRRPVTRRCTAAGGILQPIEKKRGLTTAEY